MPRIGIAVELPFIARRKISLGIVYMGRDGKNQMKDKDKGGPAMAAQHLLRGEGSEYGAGRAPEKDALCTPRQTRETAKRLPGIRLFGWFGHFEILLISA